MTTFVWLCVVIGAFLIGCIVGALLFLGAGLLVASSEPTAKEAK